MSDKPVIFISHSARDKDLVVEIAEEIEIELQKQVDTFLSSRPDAIPSGATWFEDVMEKLERADALVVLITDSSEKSVWIGFELGYFWKNKNGQFIYALKDSRTSIPSPLDRLQAKNIDDKNEVTNFLENLCQQFGIKCEHKANFEAILKKYMSRYDIEEATDLPDWVTNIRG